MNKRTLLSIITAATLAMGAGTAIAGDADDILALGQAKITLQQAMDAALKKYAGARVVDAEFDSHKNGTAEYEIELVTANNQVFKLIVDPQTGNIVSDRPHGQRRNPIPQTSISMEQAIITALQQHNGSRALNVDVDVHKNGSVDYDIEVVTADNQIYKVKVDAQNGKVIANYLDD